MTQITLENKSSLTLETVGKEIQPMPFWLSLVLFAIPAVLMIISMYMGIPLLGDLGLEPIVSFLAAFTIPMAWMFAAALVG